MKERPTLFSGEMVRAILEGRNTPPRFHVAELVRDLAGEIHRLEQERESTAVGLARMLDAMPELGEVRS